jgi:hypothetical protein
MAMAVHADIDALMAGRLGEWLAGQEAMRAAAKDQAYTRWTWGAAVLMPVLAFLWFAPGFEEWPVKVALVGGIGTWLWGRRPITAAQKAIKTGINAAIAESLGLAYTPDVEPGPEFDLARTYALVPRHDRARFEDHWHGTLAGHSFDLYETHLEKRDQSDRRRRWVTVFRGAMIMMSYGREFHSITLLGQPDDHRSWLGFGSPKESVTLDGHQLDAVEQVHPDFDITFGVWSDDQVEARVLLHPVFIEHLLTVERAFGRGLRVLFHKGHMILAIESDKLFESGALDGAADRSRAEHTAGQFATLAELALAINQCERGRALGASVSSAAAL